MKPNEQIQKTFDLMQKDMKSKWYKCIITYYIRPEWVDIDKVTDEQSMWFSHTTLSIYDYVCFEKYLKDNLFNTNNN